MGNQRKKRPTSIPVTEASNNEGANETDAQRYNDDENLGLLPTIHGLSVTSDPRAVRRLRINMGDSESLTIEVKKLENGRISITLSPWGTASNPVAIPITILPREGYPEVKKLELVSQAQGLEVEVRPGREEADLWTVQGGTLELLTPEHCYED